MFSLNTGLYFKTGPSVKTVVTKRKDNRNRVFISTTIWVKNDYLSLTGKVFPVSVSTYPFFLHCTDERGSRTKWFRVTQDHKYTYILQEMSYSFGDSIIPVENHM